MEEKITSVFVPSIEASVHEFVAKWQDRDETDNFGQKYDQELVKDELRPIVFEEVSQYLSQRAGAGDWWPMNVTYESTRADLPHIFLAVISSPLTVFFNLFSGPSSR